MEFCSHIVHSYITSVAMTRLGKASEALSVMGSSVSSIKCRKTQEIFFNLNILKESLNFLGQIKKFIYIYIHSFVGILRDHFDEICRNHGAGVREVADFPSFLFQNVFGDCSVRRSTRSNILTSVIKLYR